MYLFVIINIIIRFSSYKYNNYRYHSLRSFRLGGNAVHTRDSNTSKFQTWPARNVDTKYLFLCYINSWCSNYIYLSDIKSGNSFFFAFFPYKHRATSKLTQHIIFFKMAAMMLWSDWLPQKKRDLSLINIDQYDHYFQYPENNDHYCSSFNIS